MLGLKDCRRDDSPVGTDINIHKATSAPAVVQEAASTSNREMVLTAAAMPVDM